MQPRQSYLESGTGTRMIPESVVEELRTGKRDAGEWLRYCDENAIGDWPLTPRAAQAAS